MTDEPSELTVSVSVENHELDEQQQAVVDLYEQNAETFLRKNEDYGGSFENSARMESILRYGEVRTEEIPDIVAEQILVRGFYDKLSRFHQIGIQGSSSMVGDESVEDTLLDMANYAIMLASILDRFDDERRTGDAR